MTLTLIRTVTNSGKQSVGISEQDKALFVTVFQQENAPEKLDYFRIDNAFEGVQQQLFDQGKFNNV